MIGTAEVEYETCLFVGGVADGERRQVPTNVQTMHVPLPVKLRSGDSDSPLPNAIQNEPYGSLELTMGDFSARVFGTLHGTGGNVLQMLVERYPGRTEVDRKRAVYDSLDEANRLVSEITQVPPAELARLQVQLRGVLLAASTTLLEMTG